MKVFIAHNDSIIPGFGAEDGFIVPVVGVCGLDGIGNVEPAWAPPLLTPVEFVVPGVGGNLGSIDVDDGVNGVLDPDKRLSGCPLAND